MAAKPSDNPAAKPGPLSSTLNTDVQLAVGQLFYTNADKQIEACAFQFNPTELERSRTIKYTRTPTGNTLEEPGAGERNQTKRKATRKPDPWELTLTLKFDASRPMFNQPLPKVPPRSSDHNAASAYAAILDAEPKLPLPTPGTVFAARAALNTDSTLTPFSGEVERIARTMAFFEALAEVRPNTVEADKIANADETSPPPFLTLAFGQRSWRCGVKSIRIKEEDYTYDLYPRRFEVSLNLEIIETVDQVERRSGTKP